MEHLTGKVALVTGASSGIGCAISKEFVKLGMTVIGAARRIDRLKDMENELSPEKGIFVPYECDVTKTKEIYDLFAFIKEKYMGLNICVNNAGSILSTSLIDGNPEEWKYLMDLNLISACLCSKLTIKSLQERCINQGHIINIVSQAGHTVFPFGFTHFYSATKFALKAISDGFRQELRACNSKIKVTEISPGLTNTEMLTKMPLEGLPDCGYQVEPLMPEDVAAVVIQVLSLPSQVEVNQILVGQ